MKPISTAAVQTTKTAKRKPAMRANSGHSGPGKIATTARRDLIVWVDHAKVQHVENATPGMLHRDIKDARRIRTGFQYKGQRNYHGLYAVIQTGQHVWYESLFEMTALMSLDFTARLTSVVTQPMMMQFGDGTIHTPDFFALHADGRQVVYDVRPTHLIDLSTAEQFANTKRVCKIIGWDYQLFTSINPVAKANLEWLAGYRHPRYLPDETTRTRILAATETPTAFRDLALIADSGNPARGAIAVYNLLWERQLSFDMTLQLTTYTPITKAL